MSDRTSEASALESELQALRLELAEMQLDHRQAEQARERLRLFATAAENMQLGLTITDMNGTILYTNPAEAEMHGYEAGELLGQDVRLFAPRELHKPIESNDQSELASWHRESVNLKKDGTRFEVHLTSDVVRDSAGVPVGFVTTSMDITERKHTEEELKRSEARHRAIVQNATYGIYRTDLEERFISVNPALVKMLGYDTEQEVLALDPSEDVYLDPEERTWLSEQHRDGERIDGIVVHWKRKDETPITVRLNGRPLRTEQGEPVGTEIFAEDITQQRQLEAQVFHTQKIEAVGQLTGGIAHDFNNLLTVILASASMIDVALSDDRHGLEQDLRDLQAAARRGTALVKRLLSFSRRAMLSLQPLDLGQVVRSFMRTMKRLLPETIELEVVGERHLPLVSADPNAVEQVISNLVNNARDAMPWGGQLRVETRTEVLDEAHRAVSGWGDPGEYVCLTVTDTGVGMDQETLTKVYEPFFTTKEQGLGTGLGMSTVYGLMKQHKGFVDVVSEVGRGTTVKTYFRPTSSKAAPFASDKLAVEPPGGTETILVVEDEASIRRATRRVLERCGYQVILAADGEEGLKALDSRGDEVALVISDAVMPRMSGLELYQAMVAAGISKKFMFMSGYSARDVYAKVDPDAELPFLQKPWTPNELLGLVRDVLDGMA
jgi:two-component system NtrC family sensor kinase